jgi:hypothetical protein
MADMVLKYKDINIIYCTANYGVYARFLASFLSPAEYIMVFDDDTIPGKDWALNCKETFETVGENAIIGARGIRLGLDGIESQPFGNEMDTREITEVDLVGHSWITKKTNVLKMFKEYPLNVMNGEDSHLSAICQIEDGIKTYVPSQPSYEPNRKGSTRHTLGIGPGRISCRISPQEHFTQRATVSNYWRSKGWKIYNERNKGVS